MVSNRQMHTTNQESESNSCSADTPVGITAFLCSASLLCLDQPRLLPEMDDLMIPQQGTTLPFPVPLPHLVAWLVSGNTAAQQASHMTPWLSSWRSSTSKNYDSAWNIWEQWCSDHHRSPISPSIGSIINILADMFKSGKAYRSLNCYCSTSSSTVEPVDGFIVGLDLQGSESSLSAQTSVSEV